MIDSLKNERGDASRQRPWDTAEQEVVKLLAGTLEGLEAYLKTAIRREKAPPGFPGEIAFLDDRYGIGKERGPYAPERADQMARLDFLIQKAGIKPGDEIEILWRYHRRDGRGFYHEYVWETPEYGTRDEERRFNPFRSGLVFQEVYNGRFNMMDSAGKTRTNWTELDDIIGIRKRASVV